VLTYCKQRQLQWDKIKSTLPDELHPCFQLSANGLRKLAALTCLVSQLPYDSWAYRDNCFTSYDMDFRLAALQQKQACLLPLERKLAQFLDTNLLSDSASLVQLQNIIDHAGMLRWFSGRWRKAKQKTLSLVVNKQLKLNDIALLFPAMITYSHVNQEFNTLFAQEAILAELNRGTQSKLKIIECVREWYKDVIFQIDEAFCGDTAIAQGLFNLNAQSACELQQVYSDELVVHIAQLNRKIAKLQLAFPDYACLHNADSEFTGVIMALRSILAEQITVLNEHGMDKGQSLTSCLNC
jgi:hypothetical protein